MARSKKEKDDKTPKSRKPANTAFRQQRLQAFLPLLTPKSVLPLFFAIGIVLAPLGGGLLYASEEIQKIEIDYSNCATRAPTDTPGTIPSNLISTSFKKSNSSGSSSSIQQAATWIRYSNSSDADSPICQLQFQIPDDLQPPVLLYYKLTNFYQNHRRYVKSVSENQLRGDAISVSEANSNCDPLGSIDGKAIYPCGLIANSQFNDSISSPVLVGGPSGDQTYTMTMDGIAWSSDRNLYKPTKYTADQIVPPPNWAKRYPNGYTSDNLPDLQHDYEFQNWMRTAGLPTFSKLYRRQGQTAMTAGTYQINITSSFPVDSFGGTKSLIISTRTVIGGKNPFLGIAYIVTGSLCILLGLLFTARHLIKPRKLGDHRYLTWNQQGGEGTTTAVAGAI
ncbi:alkylphosphocholine resistance protein lem3 [Savitreella phatthalungensis]